MRKVVFGWAPAAALHTPRPIAGFPRPTLHTAFSAQASKAWTGAALAALAPLLAYLQATGDWSWRAFGAAVVSGLVAGIGVYAVPNRP